MSDTMAADIETTRQRLGLTDRLRELEETGRVERGNTATVLPGTHFDELVVGSWLHIEDMNGGTWWMSLGGVVVHVTARADGTPKQVSVDMPGGYDEPRKGCTYRHDGKEWTP